MRKGLTGRVTVPAVAKVGFTLIEVLIASAVLATIATGLLASTWRLAAYANDEVDLMTAAMICEDLWSCVRKMPDAEIDKAALAKDVTIDPERALPYFKSKNLLGQEKKVYPLWRTQDTTKKPTFRVQVKELTTPRKVSISVKWYGHNYFKPNEWFEYSPDEGAGRVADVL